MHSQHTSRTTAYALALIQAVQSTNAAVLRGEIFNLEAIAEEEVAHLATESEMAWARKSYIDSALPGIGLTALHVAAKSYALHKHRPLLAAAFNEMVQLLLEAGANPTLPIGRKTRKTQYGEQITDPGRTIAQECRGAMPPALTAYFAQLPSDSLLGNRALSIETHVTTRAREERRMAQKQVA